MLILDRGRGGSGFTVALAAALTLAVLQPVRTEAAPPPDQASIVVTGSSLSALTTQPPTLTPAFNPSTTDYVMWCQAGVNPITLTLTAASGTITVGSQTGTTLQLGAPLIENQAIVVTAPDPSNPANPPVHYWIRCLPHDFPHITVNRPGSPPAGWYLTGNISTSSSAGSATYAMILDNNGTPVWYRSAPGGAIDVELLPNNTIAWAPLLGPGIGANPNGGFNLYRLDTQTTSLVRAPIPPTDPHELLQMSNGHRMVIATPLKSGVDLSAFGTAFPGVTTIVDCVVQEMDAQGNLVWSWTASDHIGLDEASGTTPRLTQLQTVNGVKAADVYHCNSVDLDPTSADPSAAAVLVSVRHINAVLLIDRSSHNVIWKLGGTGTSKDAGAKILTINGDTHGPFSGQHDARFQSGTELSLYDDHSAQPGGAARAVQYGIDPVAGTATLDFEYLSPDGKNSLATGGFRRYAAGADNLVEWGFKPGAGFSEIDGSGTLLMNVHFTNGEVEYRTVKEATGALDLNLLRSTAGLPRPGCIVPSISGTGSGGGSTSFYFAEGFTGNGFRECLALLMPKASGLATIDYWTNNGGHTTGTVQLTAGQVTMVSVNQVVGPDQQVAVRVTLPGPGIVQRQMYFNNGTWYGSTDVTGVGQTAQEWDFAEGSTLPAFNEYLSLFNPNSTPAVVDLNYATDYQNMHPVKTLSLPPGRTTVAVYEGDLGDNGTCVALTSCGVGPGIVGVSVQVKSRTLPIVAERPMYVMNYSFGSGPIRDGDDAFGANAAATTWNFAEGTTLGGFNEYLTLQNPGNVPATVTLTYLYDLGSTQVQLTLAPQSRQTALVFDPANFGVGAGYVGVSVTVTSDQPVVAERPMYIYRSFSGNGGTGPVAGAHVIVGATSFGTLFGFAAADTETGHNDYLTIQNTNGVPATITIDYYVDGNTIVKTLIVPGGTRHTVLIFADDGEGVGPQPNPFGIVVSADQPVLVEKPGYSTVPSTYGATVTTGYSPAAF